MSDQQFPPPITRQFSRNPPDPYNLCPRDPYSTRILSRHARLSLGLDLGQSRDYSVLACLEAVTYTLDLRDPYTFNHLQIRRFELRNILRWKLGTPFTSIVDNVARLHHQHWRRDYFIDLTSDATGIGAPVIELFRNHRTQLELYPVLITSGSTESYSNGRHHVPKDRLIHNLQLALEQDQIRISSNLRHRDLLMKEFRNMETRDSNTTKTHAARGPHHDDLILAISLALWRSRKNL